jgi:hypothetical protein
MVEQLQERVHGLRIELALLRSALLGVRKDDDFEAKHPRGEGGRFGTGGSGASAMDQLRAARARAAARATEAAARAAAEAGSDKIRPDGKPYWTEPLPAKPGDPGHPYFRREVPALDPATYVPRTRTDPKMWEDVGGGEFMYSGADEPEVKRHAWPSMSLTPHAVLNRIAIHGDKPTGAMAVLDVANRFPVAGWVLEAHPLQKLGVGDFVSESTGAAMTATGGIYNLRTGEMLLNTESLGRAPAPSFKFGHGNWTVFGDAHGDREQAAATILHETGHHIETVPGVDEVVEAGWRSRSRDSASDYGRTNKHEYFAESWSAYNRDAAGLADHDRNGFDMVERALSKLERQGPALLH